MMCRGRVRGRRGEWRERQEGGEEGRQEGGEEGGRKGWMSE